MCSRDKIKYFQFKIVSWGIKHFEYYPWRNTKNKWHALVAEIMLQRTNAKQVLTVYEEFTERFPDVESFLKHSKNTHTNYFTKLGLNWRNKYLIYVADYISKHGIPTRKEKLLNIPGIGDYIASAFLSFHFGQRHALLDSNIIRLYARYFGFEYDGETRRKQWLKDLADAVTPNKDVKSFNYAILDFSRMICKQKPACNMCLISIHCNYYNLKLKSSEP